MSEIKCSVCNDSPMWVAETLGENGFPVFNPNIIFHLCFLAWSCKVCGKRDIPTLEQLDERHEKIVKPLQEARKKWKEEHGF